MYLMCIQILLHAYKFVLCENGRNEGRIANLARVSTTTYLFTFCKSADAPLGQLSPAALCYLYHSFLNVERSLALHE